MPPLSHLPTEVVLKIFEHMSPPSFGATPLIGLHSRRDSVQELEKISHYRKALCTFISESLACSSRVLRSAISSVFYQTIVIFPSTDVSALKSSLEKYGDSVQSIIYYATLGDRPNGEKTLERYRIIDACFFLMRNAQNLEVYGSHILFMSEQLRSSFLTVDPSFPQFPVPEHPPPYIRTLTWRPKQTAYNDSQLIHALQQLGPTLEELRIEGWNATPSIIASLMSPLSHLRALTLISGSFRCEDVAHLFARTLDDTLLTPLRKLTILATSSKPSNIGRLLLQHNVGSQLHDLVISFEHSCYLPSNTVSTCTALRVLCLDIHKLHSRSSRLGLSWDPPFITNLPPSLVTLVLCMSSPRYRPNATDTDQFYSVLHLIESGRLASLQHLKFAVSYYRWSRPDRNSHDIYPPMAHFDFYLEYIGVLALRRACETARVALNLKFTLGPEFRNRKP